MFETDFLTRSFVTFLINLSVTAIALLFAFWKFRMEKWWDKSFQCYMDVIDAINNLIKISDEIIQFNNNEKNLKKNDLSKLNDEFNKCQIKIGGIVTIGELLLSKQGHDLVFKFDALLYHIDVGNANEHTIAVIRDDAEAYLTQFIQISKIDLHRNSFEI